MNWYESYAFCIWDGGFLPSEAEWEYAAAGGEQQREYPWVWGSVWNPSDPGTSNQYAIYGCYYPNGSGTCTDVSNIAPVGTPPQGAGLWGQLDLAGNMVQWTLDTYSAEYDLKPCVDCANLDNLLPRACVGGNFRASASQLVSTARGDQAAGNRGIDGIGLRCARTP